MRCASLLTCTACACILSAGATGQSVNIRFGSATSTPPPTYAAAGLAGAWNAFQVPPAGVLQPLVGLQGTPIAAQFYQSGSSSILTFNNPLTTGNDEKLMDSMLLSTNSPVDGCFLVVGLALGTYEVTIYALTPNDATLMTRTRVDNGTPGPIMLGGTWPGHHQAGLTYSKFTVVTTDGTIAFHDGLYGGYLQSGMNGVQLEFLPPGAARAVDYGVGCYNNTPLTLTAAARPILGTTISLVTTNIPATAVLSANILSLTQHAPGVDLTVLGMAGCYQLVGLDDLFLLTGTGTQSRSFGPLPLGATWIGFPFYSQSVSFVPGVNPFGAVTSNGTALTIGSQ